VCSVAISKNVVQRHHVESKHELRKHPHLFKLRKRMSGWALVCRSGGFPFKAAAAPRIRNIPLLAYSTTACQRRVTPSSPRHLMHKTPNPLHSSSSLKSIPLNRLAVIQRHFTMDTNELKNFLADSPPVTVNLIIKPHWDALTESQKSYAHFISKQVNASSSSILVSN
jgi:hypothetical protein